MWLDKMLELSLLQTVLVDGVSTNVYDLGAAGRQLGTGEPLSVVIAVTTAADFTTGDETYSIEVIESASPAMTAPVVLSRRTFLASQLTLGAVISLGIPLGTPNLRYLALNYDVGGNTPSATFSAYLEPTKFVDVQPAKNYPSGYFIA